MVGDCVLFEAHYLVEAFTFYGRHFAVLGYFAIVICNDPKISGPRYKRFGNPLRKGIQFRNRQKVNIFYQCFELYAQVRLHLLLGKIYADLLRIVSLQYRVGYKIPLAYCRAACALDHFIPFDKKKLVATLWKDRCSQHLHRLWCNRPRRSFLTPTAALFR